MGMTQKELNAHLQRHGLFPDKHALMLLKEHTDKVLDQKTELAAVVLHVKNNPGLVKNKVTKEIMEEALAAEGDTENDKGENLMILDHKSVPISVYDSVRKVFVRKAGSDRSLQDNIDPITRIQAFRERFELVEQRVLNNHVFAKKSFATDESAGARPDLTRIRCVCVCVRACVRACMRVFGVSVVVFLRACLLFKRACALKTSRVDVGA